MAQDTALLRYLLKGARRAPGSGSQRDLAFAFDGTNDYISSNATIGRTGYDMNVSGNVSTGSDADGNYMSFTLSPVALVSSATAIPKISVSLAHSVAIKIKTGSDVTTTQTVFNNTVSASNRVGISITSGELRAGIYNGTSYIGKKSFAVSANTTYIIHYTWDGSSVGKIYSASVESTTVPVGDPTTSGSVGVFISRNGTGFGGFVYWCACWNKALTQAEVTADYALGNTAKNDPSIVAYYIPDNLTYNTQYMLNSSDFSNASWTKTNTTVTADTTVAPDGTTTADTLTIWTGATSGVTQISTVVSGTTAASKTFIVKAFVRVAAGTSNFRLIMYQNGVATGTSANLTATTTWQEFTFTQTFTSSTTATGITGGIINDSTGLLTPVLFAWNCRVYLVNETLRDESPNIGGFIGWKHQKVLSFWIKPNIDSVNTADSQSAMRPPRFYCHMSQTTNQLNARYDNRLGSKVSIYNLGTGFRSKVHVSCVYYWTGSVRGTKIYINGFVQDSDTFTVDPPTSSYNTVLWSGRSGTTYFSGNIRDTRIYTFTGSFTDADALSIYNGGEPTSAGVTKYLHYRPPVGEVGTTTQDQSTNDRDGTLNGGVTRNYI